MKVFRPILPEKESKSEIISLDSVKELKIAKDHSLKIGIMCPHCKNTTGIKIFESGNEINCPNCSKPFYFQIGVIRATKGLGGYTAKPVTIRFHKIEGGEEVIEYFGTKGTVDLRSGDLFGAIYKKGFFSNSYNVLIGIMNYNLMKYVYF